MAREDVNAAGAGGQVQVQRYSSLLPVAWHDGVVWGFAASTAPPLAAAVELIAVDGESLDWRLYALAPITPDAFATASGLFSRLSVASQGEASLNALRELWERSGPAVLLALTASLGTLPSRVVALPAPETVPALAHARLLGGPGTTDFERLILPRSGFLAIASRFFGPVELPDLDGVDQ